MSNTLVVTRQPKTNRNEVLLHITAASGEVITIKQTVNEIKGKQVKIAVQAPSNVKILRGELVKP